MLDQVNQGADPKSVVPNDYIVVRGGTKPMPPVGQEFSAVVGPSLEAAACAVPHGQLRWTTAGAIRSTGGIVMYVPEHSPHGTINLQHVNVTERTLSQFQSPIASPFGRKARIDEGL